MNIQFKSTKKELPKHKQYILYIKKEQSMFHDDSPLPTFAKCEWSWHDGDGSQICHKNEYSVEKPPEEYPFLLILDGEGYTIWTNETSKHDPEIEHFWWIDQKEFDKIWEQAQH